MQRFQIVFLIVTGGLAVYFQFKKVKEESLFLDDFSLATICLVISWMLTLVLLFQGIRLFKQKRSYYAFLPALVGVVVILLVFGHRYYRGAINKHQTIFQAMNYDIGTDGGFTFEFKQGGYLQGTKVDRFSTTYYWGHFVRQRDSLLLDITLDFKLGRRAYLQDNILRFQNDTTKFYLSAIQMSPTQDW
jgi:hypothetical protein